MTKYVNVFLLAILLFSCRHRESKVCPDLYTPRYSSVRLEERISKYYREGLADSLMSFLQEWNQLVPPFAKEYISQNDTIRNIYLLFADLYKPFGFGEYLAMNYFGGHHKYVIIQNEVNYAVLSKKEYKRVVTSASADYPNDTTYEYYKKTKKLLNFRPPLGFDHKAYLYLTGEYKEAINGFLNLGSFQGDIFLNDTILHRYKFLSPVLPILYGQWGGYWHIETLPIVDRVIFDENFRHAAVDFRYGFEETMLQYRVTKKSGHWKPDNKWLKIRFE